MTRTHLYEAAKALLTRKIGGGALRDWGLRIAAASGCKKAKLAVARKLAVILHAMWKTDTPFVASTRGQDAWPGQDRSHDCGVARCDVSPDSRDISS